MEWGQEKKWICIFRIQLLSFNEPVQSAVI